MSARARPLDKMRELADDGLEPWQIAAALGVREETVLVALEAREPAGGAQRAVEDAASLVPVDAPTKPDTLAPTRPLRAALVEHVAITVCGAVEAAASNEPAGPIQVDEPSAHKTPSDVTPDGHVHDPFPVADEHGIWHAECECGTRWDRALCDADDCGAYVSALHIARTGTSRHAQHPTA